MSVERATGQGIGQPLPRKEDLRLVTGKGHYAADHQLPNMAYAAMLRTPHAHALIRSIDTRAAKQAPGVIAVFTGADFVADGRKPIPHAPSWIGPPDVNLTIAADYQVYIARHLPMPSERVRFVGEPVAMVIAETLNQAKDAVELITVDYEPLDAVSRAADAIEPDAPQLWDDRTGNISLDAEVGDKASTDAAFATATHIVKFHTWINRVTGTPMEPRTAIGFIDEKGRYTIWAGTGGGMVRERQTLAGSLGVPLEQCRAMCGDMGGNFGTRNIVLPGICAAPLGGEKTGPAGEVPGRSQRILPHRLPRPRPDLDRRAGARQGWQVPRHTRRQSQQYRRATPAISRRCAKASASCRASTTFPRCISAAVR